VEVVIKEVGTGIFLRERGPGPEKRPGSYKVVLVRRKERSRLRTDGLSSQEEVGD